MAMLYFKKHSITRDLLHHIKYHQGKELAYNLGQIYGSILCSYPLTRPDLLAPVPLHHTKLKKRGFNQSSAFALGVGKAWNVAVDDSILQKKVATNTQTKMGRWVRWKNVADVFEVSEPESVYGKHIMVVDDVMTTGSTLEACGQSLRATGCESLSVMTLAYTQQ